MPFSVTLIKAMWCKLMQCHRSPELLGMRGIRKKQEPLWIMAKKIPFLSPKRFTRGNFAGELAKLTLWRMQFQQAESHIAKARDTTASLINRMHHHPRGSSSIRRRVSRADTGLGSPCPRWEPSDRKGLGLWQRITLIYQWRARVEVNSISLMKGL